MEDLVVFFDETGEEEQSEEMQDLLQRLDAVSDNEGDEGDIDDIAVELDQWLNAFVS
jgi:hypothetical protein